MLNRRYSDFHGGPGAPFSPAEGPAAAHGGGADWANSLLLHHAIHKEPLSKESLEYVMKGCTEAFGKTAELNPGRGTATWDLRIGGAGWSLKTEAARGISPGTVKIEKLMEARWIRKYTNPAKCAAVRTHVLAHMADYDRIIVLRAFRLNDGACAMTWWSRRSHVRPDYDAVAAASLGLAHRPDHRGHRLDDRRVLTPPW